MSFLSSPVPFWDHKRPWESSTSCRAFGFGYCRSLCFLLTTCEGKCSESHGGADRQTLRCCPQPPRAAAGCGEFRLNVKTSCPVVGGTVNFANSGGWPEFPIGHWGQELCNKACSARLPALQSRPFEWLVLKIWKWIIAVGDWRADASAVMSFVTDLTPSFTLPCTVTIFELRTPFRCYSFGVSCGPTVLETNFGQLRYRCLQVACPKWGSHQTQFSGEGECHAHSPSESFYRSMTHCPSVYASATVYYLSLLAAVSGFVRCLALRFVCRGGWLCIVRVTQDRGEVPVSGA